MIEYRETHAFSARELERLFLSVEWSSGHFPDKLVLAMRGFRTVFSAWELERLFLSVEWSSGHFPDKLALAMRGFRTVFSAWEGDLLVGLIAVMDDGVMNAYVHYLLVDPAYQGQGIGRTLVSMMKEKYKDYLRVAVIGYDREVSFYENCGFVKSEDSSPLFITSLWT